MILYRISGGETGDTIWMDPKIIALGNEYLVGQRHLTNLQWPESNGSQSQWKGKLDVVILLGVLGR